MLASFWPLLLPIAEPRHSQIIKPLFAGYISAIQAALSLQWEYLSKEYVLLMYANRVLFLMSSSKTFSFFLLPFQVHCCESLLSQFPSTIADVNINIIV